MVLKSKKQSKKFREQGMSLVEVLLVLVIIGVIFGLITGSFRSPRAKIMNDLNELRLDFKTASRNALLTGKVHRLIFDLRENKHWLEVTDHKFLTVKDFGEQAEKFDQEKLKEELKKYEDLAGPEVTNDKGDKLPTPSIVVTNLKQKKALRWQKSKLLGKRSFKALDLKEFKNSRMEKAGLIKELKEAEQKQLSLLFLPSGRMEEANLLLTPKSTPDQTYHFAITAEGEIEFGAGPFEPKKRS